MFYEFTLRKVKVRDFDSIKCLSEMIVGGIPRIDKDRFGILIASKNFLGLVATYKAKKTPEEFVGYGSVCFHSSFTAGKTALVEDLIVWKQHRKKRIEGLILARLIEEADKKMMDRIVLTRVPDQEEDISLYKSLEFVEEDMSLFVKDLS